MCMYILLPATSTPTRCSAIVGHLTPALRLLTPDLLPVTVHAYLQCCSTLREFIPLQPSDDVLRVLHTLLGEKKVLSVTGVFVWKIFDVFNTVELVWPEA